MIKITLILFVFLCGCSEDISKDETKSKIENLQSHISDLESRLSEVEDEIDK